MEMKIPCQNARYQIYYVIIYCCNRTKCLKNQPCNVIQMSKMREEVGKKTPKNEMDNPSFLWRNMAYFLDTLSSYSIVSYKFPK